MQSTGHTSRQASQPVQLSALMTATSLGSFLRDPDFAIICHLKLYFCRLAASSPRRSIVYRKPLNCIGFCPTRHDQSVAAFVASITAMVWPAADAPVGYILASDSGKGNRPLSIRLVSQ